MWCKEGSCFWHTCCYMVWVEQVCHNGVWLARTNHVGRGSERGAVDGAGVPLCRSARVCCCAERANGPFCLVLDVFWRGPRHKHVSLVATSSQRNLVRASASRSNPLAGWSNPGVTLVEGCGCGRTDGLAWACRVLVVGRARLGCTLRTTRTLVGGWCCWCRNAGRPSIPPLL